MLEILFCVFNEFHRINAGQIEEEIIWVLRVQAVRFYFVVRKVLQIECHDDVCRRNNSCGEYVPIIRIW